jgi:PPP5.
VIEGEYSGPKLEDGKVTLEFMEHLMKTYKDQGKLHRRYAYKVGTNWCLNSSPDSFKMFCCIVYIFQYTSYDIIAMYILVPERLSIACSSRLPPAYWNIYH